MNIEELACKIACQELLARLCQALDRGANSEAAALFTDDAVLAMPNGEVSGPAVRTTFEARPSTVATRHLLTNVIVTPTVPNSAEGVAYIMVYRTPRTADDVLPRRLPATAQVVGEWSVEFRKTEAGWRISRQAVTSVMEPPK